MGSVQENPKLSTGEKVVNVIGKIVITCIAVPIAKLWRLFNKRK